MSVLYSVPKNPVLDEKFAEKKIVQGRALDPTKKLGESEQPWPLAQYLIFLDLDKMDIYRDKPKERKRHSNLNFFVDNQLT